MAESKLQLNYCLARLWQNLGKLLLACGNETETGAGAELSKSRVGLGWDWDWDCIILYCTVLELKLG